MSNDDADAAAEAIRSCRRWTDVSIGDDAGLVAVEQDVRGVVAGRDVATILEGMGRAVEQDAESAGPNVGLMGTLYVLNRLLFDVPEWVPAGQPRFAAFTGIPQRDGELGELWPWAPAGKDALRLRGHFRGYVGEAYQALREAEAFQRRYGQRHAG